jgi:hypothetical protein
MSCKLTTAIITNSIKEYYDGGMHWMGFYIDTQEDLNAILHLAKSGSKELLLKFETITGTIEDFENMEA